MQAADTAALVTLENLPAIGEDWPLVNGIYAGITTGSDGQPCALVLLNDKPASSLTWRKAMDWAEGLSASLPTRPESAMLFANVPGAFERARHWTSESHSAHLAWYQYFVGGYQDFDDKDLELRARAVRRFKAG